jgi:catechol 2,3-dioxygenase
VYLKAWDEHDHHSIVLRHADKPGCDYFAFKVAGDGALTEIEQRIRAHGVGVKRIEAGVYPKSGRRIEFVLPSGHTMQLYAEKEQVGNTLGNRNPGVLRDEGVLRGLRINRLDHILLGGVKLDETVHLFCEVLDFSLSEKLVDHGSGPSLAVFLTCSNKPHDIAFVLQAQPNRFHHISFLLESTHDVLHAADLIGKYWVDSIGCRNISATRSCDGHKKAASI